MVEGKQSESKESTLRNESQVWKHDMGLISHHNFFGANVGQFGLKKTLYPIRETQISCEDPILSPKVRSKKECLGPQFSWDPNHDVYHIPPPLQAMN